MPITIMTTQLNVKYWKKTEYVKETKLVKSFDTYTKLEVNSFSIVIKSVILQDVQEKYFLPLESYHGYLSSAWGLSR